MDKASVSAWLIHSHWNLSLFFPLASPSPRHLPASQSSVYPRSGVTVVLRQAAGACAVNNGLNRGWCRRQVVLQLVRIRAAGAGSGRRISVEGDGREAHS